MLVLRAVYKLCRPHWLSFGFFLICLTIFSVYSALSPLSFKYLIDDAFLPGNIRMFWLILGLLVAGGVLAFAAAIMGERILALVTERVLYRVRSQMFDQMTRQSLEFYDRFDQGTLMSRATSDVATADQVVSGIVPNMFRQLLSLGVGITLLLKLERKLRAMFDAGFRLIYIFALLDRVPFMAFMLLNAGRSMDRSGLTGQICGRRMRNISAR